MKRYYLLLLAVILLSGCFHSKEAKQFKKDKEVQMEIERLIQEHGMDEYGMELYPEMKKMKFAIVGKFPWPTDNILVVPVKTNGKPEYKFEANIHIYNEKTDNYEVNDQSIDISNLEQIGPFLLEKTFLALHKDAFDTLKNVDRGIKINSIETEATFNHYFEDKTEERMLKKAFAADYISDKFIEPSQFERLIDDHMIQWDENAREGWECEPRIRIEVKEPVDESVTSEEKVQNIIEYIESENNLPQGIYSITLDLEDEQIYESVALCK